jgi:deazaflavin-dependent oxidoreductase (nitroreductase family)
VRSQKEIHMTTADFKKALTSTRELEITVTGRKSGRKISTPVWFVHEGDTLYLLPVKGSDSDWYKNILRTPTMRLSTGDAEITVNAKPITDPNRVREIVDRFRAKYGEADVRRYYSKFDVAVEVRLDS